MSDYESLSPMRPSNELWCSMLRKCSCYAMPQNVTISAGELKTIVGIARANCQCYEVRFHSQVIFHFCWILVAYQKPINMLIASVFVCHDGHHFFIYMELFWNKNKRLAWMNHNIERLHYAPNESLRNFSLWEPDQVLIRGLWLSPEDIIILVQQKWDDITPSISRVRTKRMHYFASAKRLSVTVIRLHFWTGFWKTVTKNQEQ